MVIVAIICDVWDVTCLFIGKIGMRQHINSIVLSF